MSSVLEDPIFIAAFAVTGVIVWSLLRSSNKEKAPPEPVKKDRGLPASTDAAEAVAVNESTEAPSTAASTGKKKKKKKSKAKKKAATPEPEPEPEIAPVKAEAELTTTESGGGGKKKKKKKSGGATNGATATKKASTAKTTAKAERTMEDSDSDDDREETIRPAAAPVRQSAQLPKTQGLTKAEKKQQLADLNDGWEIAADPKKKKKKGAKKVAPAQTNNTKDAAASSGEVKISVTVEAKKIGIVIGPKGATMQSVQEATNTKLEVNASKEANDRKPASVTITGKKADAERAKKAIQELCTKGYTTLTQEAGFAENSISVHPQVLSEIVGPGGKNIRAIQEKLGVKITIPSTDWKPNQPQLGKVMPARVGIAGDRDACKKAKEVIQSISRWHHHEVTHPGLIHEEVDVPSEFLHCVIGARGSEIRHIRGNYSCDVYIPNADSHSEYVVVVGRPVQVEKAIKHINNLMDRETERNEARYDDEAY